MVAAAGLAVASSQQELSVAGPLAALLLVGMFDDILAAAVVFAAATMLAAVAFSWFSSQYLQPVAVTWF